MYILLSAYEIRSRFLCRGARSLACKKNCRLIKQCYQEGTRLQDGEVGDGQGTFTETVQDYFRAEYYVIDACSPGMCIRQRFNQPGYQTYYRLENLLASALNGTDYQQDLNFIADFYGDDIDKVLLQTQMDLPINSLVSFS